LANHLLFYDTGEGEANSIGPVGAVPMKFGYSIRSPKKIGIRL